MPDDLRNPAAGRHLVVGFFTPNYRRLAEAFAANLKTHRQPFHLYAVPAVTRWEDATLKKPEIVLRAMADYPERTLILMDVDCTLHADISELADDAGDITLNVKAWRQARVFPHACASSRMIAFRPTPKARELAERWKRFNSEYGARNDEASLTLALSRTMGLTITTMPGVAGADEAVFERHPCVTHDSAHTSIIGRPNRTFSRSLKRWKRAAFKAITGSDYDLWRYAGTRPPSPSGR